MEGVHVVGAGPGSLGDGSDPSGVQGQRPGRGCGGRSSQKLKQNLFDLMNIRAGLGEYILQTHNKIFFEDSMGV